MNKKMLVALAAGLGLYLYFQGDKTPPAPVCPGPNCPVQPTKPQPILPTKPKTPPKPSPN